ncbi:hypothetical protein V8J82_15620 [Gymnodinialimonas sp. 2305UL16-5]|uniref:hypothetical protein n=1 Tax=Gymnodinialimonas mytili TaxID=3126503 RepID=UPI0030B72C6A
MAYMQLVAAANAEHRDVTGAALGRRTLETGKRDTGMGRILIILVFLAFLGFVALLGYAYSGFLQPEVQNVTQPIDLDLD